MDKKDKEILRLKEILFVLGEIAIVIFDDKIVGIVDKTLKGFKITKKRYLELLKEL